MENINLDQSHPSIESPAMRDPLTHILDHLDNADLARVETTSKCMRAVVNQVWEKRAQLYAGKPEAMSAKKWVYIQDLWQKGLEALPPAFKEWVEANYSAGNGACVYLKDKDENLWRLSISCFKSESRKQEGLVFLLEGHHEFFLYSAAHAAESDIPIYENQFEKRTPNFGFVSTSDNNKCPSKISDLLKNGTVVKYQEKEKSFIPARMPGLESTLQTKLAEKPLIFSVPKKSDSLEFKEKRVNKKMVALITFGLLTAILGGTAGLLYGLDPSLFTRLFHLIKG